MTTAADPIRLAVVLDAYVGNDGSTTADDYNATGAALCPAAPARLGGTAKGCRGSEERGTDPTRQTFASLGAGTTDAESPDRREK